MPRFHFYTPAIVLLGNWVQWRGRQLSRVLTRMLRRGTKLPPGKRKSSPRRSMAPEALKTKISPSKTAQFPWPCHEPGQFLMLKTTAFLFWGFGMVIRPNFTHNVKIHTTATRLFRVSPPRIPTLLVHVLRCRKRLRSDFTSFSRSSIRHHRLGGWCSVASKQTIAFTTSFNIIMIN